MAIDINKLYAILVYGYNIDEDSPFYKKHSIVLPTEASIKLRDYLYLGISKENIPACAFLICSLMPETSSWNLICAYDANNTYSISYRDKEMAGLGEILNIEKATTLLPPDLRLSIFATSWIDRLGVIALTILQGAI